MPDEHSGESGGKLDILLCASSLGGGGAERVIANMASWWAAAGFSVGLLTLSDSRDDAYALHPDVERIALDLYSVSSGLVSALAANWHRVRALRAVMKQRQAPVVIGFLTEVNVTLLIAARGLGIRVIVSERNYPPAESIARQWTVLRRYLYPSASVVMAQTERAAAWLRDNTRAKKVEVLPNPVVWPLSPGEPRLVPEDYLSAEVPLIVAAGRLDRQKGFDLLIEAFAAVANQYPKWQLVIIGSGREHDALMTRISTSGMQNQVRLLGRVGNIGDWYQRCQLFVLSSRFEGFPNVLLEAMADGCTVLSTDCDAGPSDLIDHGISGHLVPSEDTAALSEGLRCVMADAEYRNQLSRRAVDVRQKYSEDTVMARWSDIAGLPGKKSNKTTFTDNRS